jgi:hypothetical protein
LSQLEQKHIEVDTSENKDSLPASVRDFAAFNSIESKNKTKEKLAAATDKPMQLNFFDIGDPRLQRIKDALDGMDLNATTPIELMMKVAEWKRMLEG